MPDLKDPRPVLSTGRASGSAGGAEICLQNITFTPQVQLKKTFIHAAGRVVGAVVGGIFRKSVIGSKHFLQRPPAIALDAGSLAQAEAAGAVEVEVFDRETGVTYSATLRQVRQHGFRLNRGFGEQIALPMCGWTRQTGPEAQHGH